MNKKQDVRLKTMLRLCGVVLVFLALLMSLHWLPKDALIGRYHIILSRRLIAWFAVDFGQHDNVWQIKTSWPDIHWLARDKGGLVAAIFETWP
jgi:hypothetical protein